MLWESKILQSLVPQPRLVSTKTRARSVKVGPLLRVTWRDAFVPTDALTTWWDGTELAAFIEEQDFVVETVGFKVWEDRETLILAQTFARRAGKISGIWRIPVGCILKRERLAKRT